MKIRTVLEHLTTEELAELGRVLQCGFLGNPPIVLQYYQACVHLMNTNMEWDEKQLSIQLYPEKDPSTVQNYLRTRTSKLLKYVEKYLAFKKFQNLPHFQEFCLAVSLSDRGWESDYVQVAKRIIKGVDDGPITWFPKRATRLAMLEHTVESPFQDKVLATNQIILRQLDDLDSIFIFKKLSLACHAASYDLEYGTSIQIKGLKECIDLKNGLPDSVRPLIEMYALLYKITTEIDSHPDQEFQMAKALLIELSGTIEKIGSEELSDAFKHLLNYCTRRCNQKARDFTAELAELYMIGINKKILVRHGKIDGRDYINAFKAFLHAERLEKIKWLIDDWGARIQGDVGLCVKHFCNGYQMLRAAKFEEADAHFFNAYNSPPRPRWPPLEAEILAQLSRTKYLCGDYPQSQYFASTLLSKLDEWKSLDAAKATSFKIFSSYITLLCKMDRSKGAKSKKLRASLLRQLASEKRPFFAAGWVTDQANEIK